MEMLRYIETITTQQQTSLHTVLDQYGRGNQRGGLLVLCSDLLSEQSLGEGLARLVPPRWQVLILHVIDRQEVEPAFDGSLELMDSETGRRLPVTFEPAIVNAYRQNVADWMERMALVSARRGAAYARVFTDMPLEHKVVPYLRTRRWLV
jgi:hypothetical protein